MVNNSTLCSATILLLSITAPVASSAVTIKVVNPMEVTPLVRSDSADIREGRAVHRRVIGKEDGSRDVDVGYNTYKRGVGSDEPYAYTYDELCYIPSGEMKASSDGVTVIAKPGNFMWRPARAATQSIWVTEEAVSICAFGPARDEGWGHRLSKDEIGTLSGSVDERRQVHLYHWKYVAPRPSTEAGVIRDVVSNKKDGAVHLAATHESYKAGTIIDRPARQSDEVCWLESGALEFQSGEEDRRLKKGEFLFQPSGVSLDRVEAIQDTVAICFFRPEF